LDRLEILGTLPQYGLDYWPAQAKLIQKESSSTARLMHPRRFLRVEDYLHVPEVVREAVKSNRPCVINMDSLKRGT